MYAPMVRGCMYQCFMGLCVHTVRAYAPMLHGAMYPYGADLCARVLRRDCKRVCAASGFYGFKGFATMSRAGLFSAMTEVLTAANEKLIKYLELNSYGVRRADGRG